MVINTFLCPVAVGVGVGLLTGSGLLASVISLVWFFAKLLRTSSSVVCFNGFHVSSAVNVSAKALLTLIRPNAPLPSNR